MASAAAINKASGGVRSPRRGHTIAQLQRLAKDHWHNPDTGVEISEEEGKDHLNKMLQKKADKITAHTINKVLATQTRSRGRPMVEPPVTFRMIHGHRVPFRKAPEPFL